MDLDVAGFGPVGCHFLSLLILCHVWNVFISDIHMHTMYMIIAVISDNSCACHSIHNNHNNTVVNPIKPSPYIAVLSPVSDMQFMHELTLTTVHSSFLIKGFSFINYCTPAMAQTSANVLKMSSLTSCVLVSTLFYGIPCNLIRRCFCNSWNAIHSTVVTTKCPCHVATCIRLNDGLWWGLMVWWRGLTKVVYTIDIILLGPIHSCG